MEAWEESEPLTEETGSDGAVAAALIAAAIGVFALGLVTSLSAAVKDFKEWLIWDEAVGSLSGKSSLAFIAWLAVWPPLHFALYKRDGLLPAAIVIGGILILLGMLGIFPPIFERLKP
jgi:hypothetical protein